MIRLSVRRGAARGRSLAGRRAGRRARRAGARAGRPEPSWRLEEPEGGGSESGPRAAAGRRQVLASAAPLGRATHVATPPEKQTPPAKGPFRDRSLGRRAAPEILPEIYVERC